MEKMDKYVRHAERIFDENTQSYAIIHVDPDAKVDVIEDGSGAWVQAWVWISKAEIV
tara:strand:+ start:210 stop:380 length:171 start_codon:yes stop_codon:yes gene_type:complete